MKTLNTLPSDKGFFDTYATLIRTLILAGILAQIISFGTELGGINTAVLQALEPLHLGAWAVTIAATVALLAALTIEIGLRMAFPKAVDSILYGRWNGLHLPMSIFIWLLALVLLGTSAVLSFKNSRVIVEQFTPKTEQITTADADSIRAVALADITTTYKADSALTVASYAGRIETTVQAYDSRIKAAQSSITALQAKERRTGNSYATRIDRARQKLADIEAEKAAQLAKLTRGQADKLQALNAIRRSKEGTAGEVYKANIKDVKRKNQKAATDRVATVNSYGGGLGWFTIICQILFVISVILDRIQRKGAGITESILLGEWDFRPGWFTELWEAVSNRIKYKLHSKITAFANATPAAPKPAQPGAVYDLAEALQHVTFKLELETATDEGERVIYLNTKEPETEEPAERKRIGFWKKETTETSQKSMDPLYSTNQEGEPTNQEAKASHETTDLRHAKQQIKKYKKRVGEHTQKAIVQKRSKGKVSSRTAAAIENNKAWVNYWVGVVNSLQNN